MYALNKESDYSLIKSVDDGKTWEKHSCDLKFVGLVEDRVLNRILGFSKEGTFELIAGRDDWVKVGESFTKVLLEEYSANELSFHGSEIGQVVLTALKPGWMTMVFVSVPSIDWLKQDLVMIKGDLLTKLPAELFESGILPYLHSGGVLAKLQE